MSSFETVYNSGIDSEDDPDDNKPTQITISKATRLINSGFIDILPSTPHELSPIPLEESSENKTTDRSVSDKSTLHSTSRATSVSYSGIQSESFYNGDDTLPTTTNTLNSMTTSLRSTQAKQTHKLSKRKRCMQPVRLADKRIYMNVAFLDQIINLEKMTWKYQQTTDTATSDMSKNDAILRILQCSVNRHLIYDYFKMIQFERCCTLLYNSYRPFEQNMENSLKPKTNENKTDLEYIKNRIIESNQEKKSILYYATICALYPFLFTSSLPSTCSNDSDSTIEQNTDEDSKLSSQLLRINNKKNSLDNSTFNPDLMITSEGLCDHVREIFNLDRHEYNIYQVKAMRKLLSSKSHPQILKEEFKRQQFIIENDRHPYYKLDKFQTERTYSVWKDRSLSSIRSMLNNLEHVSCTVSDEVLCANEEMIMRYIYKLGVYPAYYESLVAQIFKNLVSNDSTHHYKLTSNSQRLLKEFQMRYCVDPFDAVLIELKYLTDCFVIESSYFETLTNYFRHIHLFLSINRVEAESQHYPVLMDQLCKLFSILEAAYTKLINICKDLKSIFPGGNDRDISSLLDLIQEIQSLNELLNRSTSVPIFELIKINLKIGLQELYMKTKKELLESNVEGSMNNNSTGPQVLSTNIIYSLIVFSRDQIKYYNRIFAEKFLIKVEDSTHLVVTTLYNMLMKDVKFLCENYIDESSDYSTFNLNFLALAHRLSQLDKEFSSIIVLEKQIWRSYYVNHVANWILAINQICIQIIHRRLIPCDDYQEISIIKSGFYRTNFRGVHSSATNISRQPNYSTLHQNRISSITSDNTTDSAHSIFSDDSKSAFRVFNKLKHARETRAQKTRRTSTLNEDSAVILAISPPVSSSLSSSQNRPLFTTADTTFDQLPCSISLIDLLIMILRYKHSCEETIELVIPNTLANDSMKFFQFKVNLYNSFYQQIFKLVDVYVINLMSLDICAANKKNLDSFFGIDLIEEIFSGSIDDRIFGCRHRLRKSKHSCRAFINKKTEYISENYEPITPEMCVRLNNLSQTKELLKYFSQQCSKTMHSLYNQALRNSSNTNIPAMHVKVEAYKSNVAYKVLDSKIEIIQTGLLKLVCFRFNLFCHQAMEVLLSPELTAYPLSIRLKPLIDFMTCNFEMFKRQMYPHLLNKFLKLLWDSFHDNFIQLLKRFDSDNLKDTKQEANTFLSMISKLLQKFKEFTNSPAYFECKVKKLNLVLDLYSRNTNILTALYYKLFNFNSQKYSQEAMAKAPENNFDLKHLIKLCKRLRKPVNGKNLVNYLRKHPPETGQGTVFDKDAAIQYAQSLLEASYIILVEIKNKKKLFNTNLNFFSNNTPRSFQYEHESNNETRSDCQSYAFNINNYDRIYLATKTNFYKLNAPAISKLTENLLFKSCSLLNDETALLYPNRDEFINSNTDNESSQLFDECIEFSIDCDFVLKIIWQRIYREQVAMRFISVRFANYKSRPGRVPGTCLIESCFE